MISSLLQPPVHGVTLLSSPLSHSSGEEKGVTLEQHVKDGVKPEEAIESQAGGMLDSFHT